MIAIRKVAVVLPAYNAAQTLAITYDEIPRDIVDEVVLRGMIFLLTIQWK